MVIRMGIPIPDLASLPGSSRPAGGGSGGGGFEYTAIDNSYSMEFDRAAGSYMTTGITVASGSDLTISFWIKGGTSGGFTNQMPFGIGLQGTSGNATAGRTWGNNYVMHTFAYVNGAIVQWIGTFGAPNATSITTDPAGDLYLGTADNNASYAWDGIIDEFAIWYGVLADTTIEAIYNATANNPGKVADLSETPEGAPTAWYRMGD